MSEVKNKGEGLSRAPPDPHDALGFVSFQLLTYRNIALVQVGQGLEERHHELARLPLGVGHLLADAVEIPCAIC